ncbi:hypothetical protein MKW98_026227 [Papaver atlanticum]|uniref:Peroxidase n=1 Tax=Papaver atlanticum TaxID=357466 RepID=A0AAD4XPK4_9MAGN|nr:hypothetical protein MKW98_026227 [Papaver atlanticum]
MGLMLHFFLTVVFVFFSISSLSFVNSASPTSFSVGFYDQSCPAVEKIIHDELVKKMSPIAHNITIPGILRLFFHDCNVQNNCFVLCVHGCDGSILILPTDDNNSERNATINLSLAQDAFDLVNKAKEALEEECPGVVSCADILAILARDVVNWWKGPNWEVEKGRKDGLISNAAEAELLMPKSNEKIHTLIRRFESVGLSTADLVTLSGAHTVGVTQCKEFATRVFYNDTTLNSTTRSKVMDECNFPQMEGIAALDQQTPFLFNNSYYKRLRERKGLLLSDHVLAFGENEFSRDLVDRYAADQKLFVEFAKAMVKMGRVGVKTGSDGETRRDCTKFN